MSHLRLDAHDVRSLLRLCGQVAALRDDPRKWRLALLDSLRSLLSAQVGVALELVNGHADGPRVASFWDLGFPTTAARNAFVRELNEPTVKDPLVLAMLGRVSDGRRTFTARRSEVIRDELWSRSPVAAARKRDAQLDDTIASVARVADRAVALTFYRHADDPAPFTDREKTLLELCHAELTWVYEDEVRRNPAHQLALSPRLRETIDYLASGLDERQTAAKMGLSPHTVHDYVKLIYAHFGVSSRQQLLDRWLASRAASPATSRPEAPPAS